MDPLIYEFFIRKAYGYKDRTNQNGANSSFFEALLIYEEKGNSKEYLQTLSDVKGYIFYAIKELQKRINKESSFDKLSEKMDELLYCKSSKCLGLIIDDCKNICKDSGLLL